MLPSIRMPKWGHLPLRARGQRQKRMFEVRQALAVRYVLSHRFCREWPARGGSGGFPPDVVGGISVHSTDAPRRQQVVLGVCGHRSKEPVGLPCDAELIGWAAWFARHDCLTMPSTRRLCPVPVGPLCQFSGAMVITTLPIFCPVSTYR
jgi:hypothetical protein